MWDSVIIYEQPMNEHIRACLRLEQLFKNAIHHIGGDSMWDSRAALTAIIHLGNLLDRADLRSKLRKEIHRQIDNLSRHSQTPHVDITALNQLLARLESIQEKLLSTEGRFGQSIRDNEFLGIVRQHLFNPGGACSFDAPVYYYWQQQPVEVRQHDLEHWLHEFDSIRSTITVLLQLIRESAAPKLKVAHDGFYQEPLDPRASCQMIRVIIPRSANVYPEISAGKHRISIRYYQPSIYDRPSQSNSDIDFKLTHCII